MTRIPNLLPSNRDLLWGTPAIEQNHGAIAILQLFTPNFQIAIFPHAPALPSERVLINGNYFFVGQGVVNFGRHVAQVVSGNQRSSQQRPQTEMRLILSRGHPTVANFEHVRIVPMPRPTVGIEVLLLVYAS